MTVNLDVFRMGSARGTIGKEVAVFHWINEEVMNMFKFRDVAFELKNGQGGKNFIIMCQNLRVRANRV